MKATSWLFLFVALELILRQVAKWRAGLESETAG